MLGQNEARGVVMQSIFRDGLSRRLRATTFISLVMEVGHLIALLLGQKTFEQGGCVRFVLAVS